MSETKLLQPLDKGKLDRGVYEARHALSKLAETVHRLAICTAEAVELLELQPLCVVLL